MSMRILFPVSEAAPLYKTGGLGDVAGSLPVALKQMGLDARIAMPKYGDIEISGSGRLGHTYSGRANGSPLQSSWKLETEFEVIYDHNLHRVKLYKGRLPDEKKKPGSSQPFVYLFDNADYISNSSNSPRAAINRYAFFSQAVVTWLTDHSGWQPQILHLHDWHVGLVPLLLKHQNGYAGRYKSLLTIHNLAYQGLAPLNITKKLNLRPDICQVLNWDGEDGDIEILMEGIVHADLVNTVSPTYAKEILTKEYGAELDLVLKSLSGKLSGILNGIDVKKWDPKTDPALVKNYTVSNWKSGKTANKLAVQKEVGLPEDEKAVMIGFIGRLDPGQKGVKLIIEAMESSNNLLPVNNNQIQIVILGTGDSDTEKELKKLAKKLPNFAAQIKFDSQLARRMYAGCDFVLVPSKYEPCGLIQMIAMRYGTLPIVRKTGGLADTVEDGETGFVFSKYDSKSMLKGIKRAISHSLDHHIFEEMVHQAMRKDFSWHKSAKEYVKLYEELLMN